MQNEENRKSFLNKEREDGLFQHFFSHMICKHIRVVISYEKSIQKETKTDKKNYNRHLWAR